jgi:hypothetical protein
LLSRSFASHVAGLFHLWSIDQKEFIMKEFALFLAALRAALVANRKAGEALAAFRPIYNRAKPEQQFEYRLKVAGVVATAYQCKVKEATYRGEKTISFEGKRKEDARNTMRYYFPALNDSRGSSNKVDPVKALLTRYGKLTAAEKRRFLASI